MAAEFPTKYHAFISYSHHDARWAKWIHRALESYRLPRELAEQANTRRLSPVFRDRDELPSATDLSESIRSALEQSRNLIVVCSPNSAKSKYVQAEIKTFRFLGRGDRIFCLIVDGEPPDCFNPALLTEGTEPIAADARPEGDGKANAKLKIIAGMLGVSFDALRKRELRRARLRTTVALGVSFAVAAVMSVLAVLAAKEQHRAEQSEAEAQRRLAESYVKIGWNHYDQHNRSAALLWHTEAFRLLTELSENPDVDPTLDDDRLRLATTQESLTQHLAFIRNVNDASYPIGGNWFAVTTAKADSQLLLLNMTTWQVKHRVPAPFGGELQQLAFLPGNWAYLVATERSDKLHLHFWDVRQFATGDFSPKRSIQLDGIEAKLSVAARAPGKLAAYVHGSNPHIQLIDVPKGEILAEIPGKVEFWEESLSPDGQLLQWAENVTGYGGTRVLYHIESGIRLAELPKSNSDPPAWSPDSQWAMHSGANKKGTVRLHRDGRIERLPLPFALQIRLSRNGHHGLLNAHGAAHVLDIQADSSQPDPYSGLGESIGRRYAPSRFELSPNARLVGLCRASGLATIFHKNHGNPIGGTIQIGDFAQVSFSPNETTAAIFSPQDKKVRIISTEIPKKPRKRILSPVELDGPELLGSVAERRSFGVHQVGDTLRIRDLSDGSVLAEGILYPKTQNRIFLRFNATRKFASISCQREESTSIDVVDLEHPQSDPVHVSADMLVSPGMHQVSPNGRWLATLDQSRILRIFNLEHPLTSPRIHQIDKLANGWLTWSPNNRLIAWRAGDQLVFFDLEKVETANLRTTHGDGLPHFSEDSKRIHFHGVTAAIARDDDGKPTLTEVFRVSPPKGLSIDSEEWDEKRGKYAMLSRGLAQVWDIQSVERISPLIPVERSRLEIGKIAMARNGDWLAISNSSRPFTWRLREVASGLPITPNLYFTENTVIRTLIVNDGSDLFVGGRQFGTTWNIRGDVTQWPLSVDESIQLAQLHAYRRIDEKGLMVELSTEEWDQLWDSTSDAVRERFMRGGLVIDGN